MKRKKTVTIFVPAFNAEKNIRKLISSLVAQKSTSLHMHKIIVISDASADGTIGEIKKVKDKRITVISNAKRKGFAANMKRILNKNTSDIVACINDDVVIEDANFIHTLCTPIVKDSTIGLVGANPVPLQPGEFLQKTAWVGYELFRRSILTLPTPHSRLSCDGKALALSKKLSKNIAYPKKLHHMGNVDSFLYFSCKKAGMKFYFNTRAHVYFRHPDNLMDMFRFAKRNILNSDAAKTQFPKLAKKEHMVKKRYMTLVKTHELIDFAPHLFILTALHVALTIALTIKPQEFNHVWKTISSTKKLRSML